MTSLETYLRSLRDDRYSGEAVKETAGYGALQNLLNDVGKGLKPRVRTIVNIKNRGAGIPDGGLFTADQFERGASDSLRTGQLPSRGAIEVKSTAEEIEDIVHSEQVQRYLGRYGQVLVTNYRDFVLVAQDRSGKPVEVDEPYRLAENEEAFWRAARNPQRTAEEQGSSFEEYLKRVMLHGAPLTQPRDLAWFLASYAREALSNVERTELPTLLQVRSALEQGLGLNFEGDRGEHFFRSTLVQTLFYGVFSAWVLWNKQTPLRSSERFDWRLAAYTLNVPMIRALFEQLVMPSRVAAMGLGRILDRTGEVLNRVDREAFFDNFDEEGAVQYFYEPFLEAFDPELRKQLGVWYTPREVVSYMVQRVDTVLRDELDIPDGLADENVYVLDPCTGTGSYLVEVLKHIRSTLAEPGEDALTAQDLKRAATRRVFGFELLPAPFVVAHLQLGLLLQNMGVPLAEEGEERIGVYLTNALTGWEPPEGPKRRLPLPEFEEERDAAEEVKQKKPILVILGNPPYNGYAGVAMSEERDLSRAYRSTKRAPRPQGQGLNDLYVRFFRMAERQIVEGTKKGVICFISNYSWLDGLSFTGMRERYLEAFDCIWIDSLNGDKYRTGKLTPDGRPDPSVFSTESNREGIQVGTAIALLVRHEDHAGAQTVAFRNLWGVSKRKELLETAVQDGETLYQHETPPLGLALPYMPLRAQADYLSWALLPELFPTSFPGVKTSRDDVVVDIDRERLVRRMEQYFDPTVSNEEMQRIAPAAMESTAGFDAESTRQRLQKRGLLRDNFVQYCYRPFDVRWLYWEPETKLLDRNRAEYFAQVFKENIFIEARQRQPKDLFDRGYVTHVLADNFGNGLSSYFPLYLRSSKARVSLLDEEDDEGKLKMNFSTGAETYLEELEASAGDLFHHVVAVLHSPAYRRENVGALRQNWPRIPLPKDQATFSNSAELGEKVAGLLNVEEPILGVTTGSIREELRALGVVSRADDSDGTLDPRSGDLVVTAGWGFRGHAGATMAGRGKSVERKYTAEERAALENGAASFDMEAEEAFARLGESTVDIYLNERAYWRNVPARVWGYTLGGYQVIKKWLSYREHEVLGRSLSVGEAREVRDMVRRIAALLLLEKRLDESYAAVKEQLYAWPAEE